MIRQRRRYRTRKHRPVQRRTGMAGHTRATVKGKDVGSHIDQQGIKLRFAQAAGLSLL